jgi:hypothetical protein
MEGLGWKFALDSLELEKRWLHSKDFYYDGVACRIWNGTSRHGKGHMIWG